MKRHGRIRILTAKVGLDGHDRGAKVISRALRDDGVEVIYAGLHQTPEMIAHAAVEEDVDAVGISILSGAHMTLLPALVRSLRERDAEEVVVFAGGIIPPEDIPVLTEQGVHRVFGPGTPLCDIVEWVHRRFGDRAKVACGP